MDIFCISLLIYIILGVSIYITEFRKYTKNIPYIPLKKKRKLLNRIFLGIVAGFHYAHFVGTYNHKKYNTQVFTPKTLECFMGGSLAGLFWIFYVIFSWRIYSCCGASGISILFFPIILNIISIIYDREKRAK